MSIPVQSARGAFKKRNSLFAFYNKMSSFFLNKTEKEITLFVNNRFFKLFARILDF
jgi:hypothetical protein